MTMYVKIAYIDGLFEVLTFRQINSKRNLKALAIWPAPILTYVNIDKYGKAPDVVVSGFHLAF